MKNIINNLFCWKELYNNKVLGIIYYIFTLNSIIYFFSFKDRFVCWPHFQSCEGLLNFVGLPHSYNQNYFLVMVFAIIIFGAFNLYKKDYIFAWLCMFFVFVIRFVYCFFIDYFAGNFNYYDVYLMFIFLFLPKKELFLKIAFVWFYFLCATIKLDESFILAKYFTSMSLGAPVFDNYSIILFSNLAIFMQILGVWFLFSRNKTLRYLAYLYIAIFHIYSGFIVSYRYIITSVPFLLVLFHPYFHQSFNIKNELTKDKLKNIPAILFLTLLLLLQSIAYIIPDNHKTTLEGNNYGFYMFEANYQCKNELFIDNKSINVRYSNDARGRCDPYVFMKSYQDLYCKIQHNTKIQWSMISSINGSPFYEIVREPDLCSLEYKPFFRNTWIKSFDSAKLIGYPYFNYFESSLLPNDVKNNFISNNIIIKDNIIQEYLNKNLKSIQSVYWILWTCVLFYIVYFIFKIHTSKYNNKDK